MSREHSIRSKNRHKPSGEFVPRYAHRIPVSLPTVHGLRSLVDIRLWVATLVKVLHGTYQHYAANTAQW